MEGDHMDESSIVSDRWGPRKTTGFFMGGF